MPPDIFKTVIIEQLVPKIPEYVHLVLTNWSKCKKKKIRTNDGGYVYFYPIEKIENIPVSLYKYHQNKV
jgi:hypothetical protein